MEKYQYIEAEFKEIVNSNRFSQLDHWTKKVFLADLTKMADIRKSKWYENELEYVKKKLSKRNRQIRNMRKNLNHKK